MLHVTRQPWYHSFKRSIKNCCPHLYCGGEQCERLLGTALGGEDHTEVVQALRRGKGGGRGGSRRGGDHTEVVQALGKGEEGQDWGEEGDKDVTLFPHSQPCAHLHYTLNDPPSTPIHTCGKLGLMVSAAM